MVMKIDAWWKTSIFGELDLDGERGGVMLPDFVELFFGIFVTLSFFPMLLWHAYACDERVHNPSFSIHFIDH